VANNKNSGSTGSWAWQVERAGQEAPLLAPPAGRKQSRVNQAAQSPEAINTARNQVKNSIR